MRKSIFHDLVSFLGVYCLYTPDVTSRLSSHVVVLFRLLEQFIDLFGRCEAVGI
jgi:hypothetical protein